MNFQRTFILSFFLNILDILEHLARQNILAGTECQLLEKQITRPSWWHLSGVWAERFSKLLNFWPRTKKKPGKAGEVVPRLDFWVYSILFGASCLWRKIFSWLQVEIGDIDINGKLLETISSTENLGLFRKISVRMMKTSRTKYTEEDFLQCWWFKLLLALRWFSVPLVSVFKNTHFDAIQEHF